MDSRNCWTRLAGVAAIVGLLATGSTSAAQDQYFDSNGVRIHYLEKGTGEPVVLVHGYSSDIESAWVKPGVFDALASRYRVIAVDWRGHGRSDKPHDPKQYGPEMSNDVVRLLAHLRVSRAHIVGYSMGGDFTAYLLTTHPEKFITATLGGASGRRNWAASDRQRAETQAQEMERGEMRTLLTGLAPPDRPAPSEAELKATAGDRLKGQDRLALAAVRRGYQDAVVTDAQMRDVRVPTLAIVGSADPNLTGVNSLKQVMPHLRVVVIDGATHSGARAAFARPEFVREIEAFLASHGKALFPK